MKKWGDLQMALQLGFWITMTMCNSYQLNIVLRVWMLSSSMSSNRCNSPYVKLYTYTTCATQLQLSRNNYCVILLQLICNYHGNVMLILFHQSIKFWHVALWGFFVWKLLFFEILIPTIHYDCCMYSYCDMCHSLKLPHHILIEVKK
jgi:hypothetical protein